MSKSSHTIHEFGKIILNNQTITTSNGNLLVNNQVVSGTGGSVNFIANDNLQGNFLIPEDVTSGNLAFFASTDGNLISNTNFVYTDLSAGIFGLGGTSGGTIMGPFSGNFFPSLYLGTDGVNLGLNYGYGILGIIIQTSGNIIIGTSNNQEIIINNTNNQVTIGNLYTGNLNVNNLIPTYFLPNTVTVTQDTSITTDVTNNSQFGGIITVNSTLAAQTKATFNVSNNLISVNALIIASITSYQGNGLPSVYVSSVSNNNFIMGLINNSTTQALNNTVTIAYMINNLNL